MDPPRKPSPRGASFSGIIPYCGAGLSWLTSSRQISASRPAPSWRFTPRARGKPAWITRPGLYIFKMPAPVRKWIDANGGYEKLPVQGFWTMYDRDLWAMGYSGAKPNEFLRL
jgi:hypothetical protein